MKPQYEPKTEQQHLGYLVEEAGEVMAAAGKALRWGLDSYNPEIPVEHRETNADWLWREMADLSGALHRMREWLHANGYAGRK
jgi:NTP pyrophosphatase (non-canonical NTP hydrolase)